jgi:CBS domain-containing protein
MLHCLQDIIRVRRAEGSLRDLVEEHMTSPAVTVGPKVSVRNAAKIMLKQKIRRLPVVDGNGKALGYVRSRHNRLWCAAQHISCMLACRKGQGAQMILTRVSASMLACCVPATHCNYARSRLVLRPTCCWFGFCACFCRLLSRSDIFKPLFKEDYEEFLEKERVRQQQQRQQQQHLQQHLQQQPPSRHLQWQLAYMIAVADQQQKQQQLSHMSWILTRERGGTVLALDQGARLGDASDIAGKLGNDQPWHRICWAEMMCFV